MMWQAVIWLFALVCLVPVPLVESVPPSKCHGGVVMGISNDRCDNARWRLWVDWDVTSDFEYRCQPEEHSLPVVENDPMTSCLRNEDIPDPIHVCMNQSIEYEDQPPRGGPHRPLWPVYGEYRYLPPQRWVHAMEHGAVVFLYHPCADRAEVNKLHRIVTSCLRKHIITPYRHLPISQPLALMTYGCKMTMNSVDVYAAAQFIMENAKNPERASEAPLWKDGQYSLGLLHKSSIVPGSNIADDVLCPNLDEMFVHKA